MFTWRIGRKRFKKLRIISGQAKGRKILAPKGLETRPITDMIKGALFNVWGNGVQQSHFLDLFAGSGSVGLEALSRGAQLVVFVDTSKTAVKTIRQNLALCGFNVNFEIYSKDVFLVLPVLHRRNLKFDYIYVDPPFTDTAIFAKIIPALDPGSLLTPDGCIVIRSAKNIDLPQQSKFLQKFRADKYGDSVLHYYRLMGEE